jgi:hypothetical protein
VGSLQIVAQESHGNKVFESFVPFNVSWHQMGGMALYKE